MRSDNIFVVGCQRSGTSVVWACLTVHPELRPLRGYDPKTGYDPKELYYFRNIFAARRQFASPMYGWDVDEEYLRKLIDMTVRHCAKHHGAANGRWVNANPADGLHLAELLETMPEVRVIYVLRHPQEVVWSAIHAPWVKRDASSRNARVEQGARHWNNFARVALDVVSGRFGPSVLLVRHEDIVAEPERIAAEITRHVGVSNDPAVLKQLSGPTFNSSFENDAKPAELIESTRKTIATERKFRKLVTKVAGEEMKALGYRDLGSPSS